MHPVLQGVVSTGDIPIFNSCLPMGASRISKPLKKGKGISVSCVCLSTEYKPEERKEFYQTLKRAFHEARGETEGKYKVLYVDSEGEDFDE